MSKTMKYVVYLTKYSGDKLPSWYIGSSYKEKVLNGYNGSIKSKKYKKIYEKEQIENKHLFRTRVLSYHETRKGALVEELRVQMMHEVKHNNNYFNESYAKINGFFGVSWDENTHPRGMNGKIHSEKTKRKMRQNRLNRTEEQEQIRKEKEKVSKSKIGEDGLNTYDRISKKRVETMSSDDFADKEILRRNRISNTLNSQAYKDNHYGKNHPNTFTIHIYNDRGELEFVSEGSFVKFCLDHSLPTEAFKLSYRHNGERLYQTKHSMTIAKKNINMRNINTGML